MNRERRRSAIAAAPQERRQGEMPGSLAIVMMFPSCPHR
jgi:hypothetical protein